MGEQVATIIVEGLAFQDTFMQNSITELENIISNYSPLLQKLDEAKASYKPSPDKWSKKQIIGLLIDSAANNHQRFVRGQFEASPQIYYNQNKWNAFGYYDKMNRQHIIALWSAYNKVLAELIKIFQKKIYSLVACHGIIHCLRLNF